MCLSLVENVVMTSARMLGCLRLGDCCIAHVRSVEQVNRRRSVSTSRKLVRGDLVTLAQVEIYDVESDARGFQQDVGYGVDARMVDLGAVRHDCTFDIAVDTVWKNKGSIFIWSGLHPSGSKCLGDESVRVMRQS